MMSENNIQTNPSTTLSDETFDIKIDVYVILNQFSGINENDKRIDNLLNEILNQPTNIQIKQILKSEYTNPIIERERQALLTKPIILRFSLETSEKYLGLPDTASFIESATKSLYKYELENSKFTIIYKEILQIFTSANILMPGLMVVNKIFAFSDNRIIRQINMYDFGSLIKKFLLKDKRNLYTTEISLKKTILWLKQIPEDEKNYSKSPLGRAIACLNHLLYTETNKFTAVIWASAAIEALYNRERNRVKEQIIEKPKTLFPTMNGLGEMYGHRSGLVHGSSDIPVYPHLSSSFALVIPRYDGETEKFFRYSLTLLFSTLQYMLANSKYELEFDRIDIIYKLRKE